MLLQVRHSFYINLYFIPSFHTFSKSSLVFFQLIRNTAQVYSKLKYSYSAMGNLKKLEITHSYHCGLRPSV